MVEIQTPRARAHIQALPRPQQSPFVDVSRTARVNEPSIRPQNSYCPPATSGEEKDNQDSPTTLACRAVSEIRDRQNHHRHRLGATSSGTLPQMAPEVQISEDKELCQSSVRNLRHGSMKQFGRRRKTRRRRRKERKEYRKARMTYGSILLYTLLVQASFLFISRRSAT